MSLPPGFIDELRDRSSIAQVVGRKVTWDARKSNPGKGDYWSPCPFHAEKTASFHVDDQKGFYYCFGCHAKGNVYNFIQETENVSFIESVEILAREAGMPMPQRDPQAQQKADHRTKLLDVMEQAVQFYRLQLKTNVAQSARDYLQNRGLSKTTLNQFEIGFAPNTRTALFDHLVGKNHSSEAIIEAGLAIKPDDGGKPFDRFRGRIMYPIRDARKRAIAFGGRAMDANQPAKYLNSPETPLFDKGRTLYNQGPAREAAGKVQSLIVAEGYMDVIALSQFGFGHTVAPLGTAITADQLQLMWRIADEPIIALDGDTAGLRAAIRLIDIALPLLSAGKSLRFAMMPEGKDPDDLLKMSGAVAMQELLDSAQPMVKLLWQRETEGKIFDSPERRAALDANLRSAINTIQDRSIKNHYGLILKDYRVELFSQSKPRQKFSNWRKTTINKPTQDSKSSLLAKSTNPEAQLREAVILMAAIRCPTAALEYETALEKCRIETPEFRKIQNILLENLHEDLSINDASTDLIHIMTEKLGYDPIEKLSELKIVREHPYLQSTSEDLMIKKTMREAVNIHMAIVGHHHETEESQDEMKGLADEYITNRLKQSSDNLHNSTRGDFDDNNSDTILADNGVEIDADEKREFNKIYDASMNIKKKT